MKKKDIIEFLEYRKNLYSYQQVDILDFELPDIKEIEDDLKILQKELDSIKDKKKASIKYVEENRDKIARKKCSHPILFGSPSRWGTFYHCMLCNKDFINNSDLEEIKETVQIIEDFKDDDGQFYRRYNFYDIYNMVIDILNNYDDEDEVNLSDEFLKLFNEDKIGDVTINVKHYTKKYNVLVIAGSNEIKIDDNTYIRKDNRDIDEIIKYLRYLDRVKVTTINNPNKINLVHRLEYKTIEEFNNKLEGVLDNKYNLVIDLSDLFKYEIKDGIINISQIKLNLKELFPDSIILDLKDRKEEIEFYKILKEVIENNNKYGNDFKKVLLRKQGYYE